MLLNAAALVLIAFATPLAAVELHLHFSAIERMLSEQVFTQDGRKYVRGDKNSKCSFAYLERAQVRGAEGKLQIRARFTGRSAVDVFGRCIGLGDAFDLVIQALPEYKDGFLGFRDVKAAAPAGGFYASRACAAIAASLDREFRFPLSAEAKRALQDAGAQPAYKRELRRFHVPSVRVTEEALVLQLDFELRVR